MQIHENFPLKPYNTFGIDVKARFLMQFSSVEELEEYLMLYSQYPIFILAVAVIFYLQKIMMVLF